MKFFLGYLRRRAFFLVPQLFGVLLITFIVVRMISGDPARLIAGGLAPEEGVEQISRYRSRFQTSANTMKSGSKTSYIEVARQSLQERSLPRKDPA